MKRTRTHTTPEDSKVKVARIADPDSIERERGQTHNVNVDDRTCGWDGWYVVMAGTRAECEIVAAAFVRIGYKLVKR